MKVYDCHLGRLGNAIFRYFASVLFCIIYKAERIYDEQQVNQCFNDNNFINFMNQLLNDNIPIIPDLNYSFYGYYQHDKIYKKYKNQIIDWIKKHPNDLLYTDGNNTKLNYYNYDEKSYYAIDLINNSNPLLINNYYPKYDVVIHLRLEDFINNNDVIHPLSIEYIINKINKKEYCFVVNKPTTELENKYIDYFKNKYNIIIESNDVITDFQIMKNAKILVCSCSTLSWCASLLSESVELVYFPNYDCTEHATFKKPIENTILYDFVKCDKKTLEDFFNNINVKIEKKDVYCALDCQRKPITNKILQYIGSIKKGFYVEVGCFNGLVQSTTVFLEQEHEWYGMLIEPSENVFEQLQNNRPNNININKCMVSNNYKENIIEGSFDQGIMSSVNNISNLQNVELTTVGCDTLENILDQLEIKHIDFMTIDTSGYEYSVLEGLNLNKHRPLYLLIEIHSCDSDKIFDYLNKNDYLFLENITNYNILDNLGWDQTHNKFLFKAMEKVIII